MDSNNLPPRSKIGNDIVEAPEQKAEMAVLQRLRDARMAALERLASEINSAHIAEVMAALRQRAIGTPPQVVENGEGGTEVIPGVQPSVAAAKLYLTISLGELKHLGGEVGQPNAPSVSREDFDRLEQIAQRYGKDLRKVKVVENVAIQTGEPSE